MILGLQAGVVGSADIGWQTTLIGMGMVLGSLLLLMLFIMIFTRVITRMQRKENTKPRTATGHEASNKELSGCDENEIAAAIAMAVFLSNGKMPAALKYMAQSENNHNEGLAPWRYLTHIRQLPPRISRF